MTINSLSKLLISVILILLFAAKKANINYGTLEGNIGIFEGNCMPSPGVPPCKPSPLSTTIFITKPAELFLPELVIDSIFSDVDGCFNIRLPVGNYSLFLRDGDKIVCDLISCNTLCICKPFTIFTDSVTVVNANLDYASW